MRPRLWLVVALSVVLLGAIVGWLVWHNSGGELNAESTPAADFKLAGDPSTSAWITSQLHYSVTVPSDWTLRTWSREEVQQSGEAVGAELPRLRQSLERWLAAFQPDSQVLVLQPTLPSSTPEAAILFSAPRHGLRLEQIAALLAEDVPRSRLIDTSLREDGQPILRVRSDQLTGLDGFADRPAEVAMLINPLSDTILVLIRVGEDQSGSKLVDTLLHDLKTER